MMPLARMRNGLGAALALMLIAASAVPARADAAFQKWLADLWPDARVAGVSRQIFNA
jgi:hypothetical protein